MACFPLVFCLLFVPPTVAKFHEKNNVHKFSFDKIGRVMHQQILALDQLLTAPSAAVRLVETSDKIRQLRANAIQTVESFHSKNVLHLFDPLIYEHLVKIGRFCDFLLIGGESLSGEVIRKRAQLLNGMGQLKARGGQVQRLMESNEMQWEIWPILTNFKRNKGPWGRGVKQLVSQLRQQISIMIEPIKMSASSYYGEMPFVEATGQLDKMASDKSEDEATKLNKLFQVVPKLMAEATQQMLRNVALDILRANGAALYSANFLMAFSNIVNGMERHCEELMRNSTLNNEQQMVRKLFNDLKNEINGTFEVRKLAIGAHFESIGKTLREEMAPLKIELGKAFEMHSKKRHKLNDGASKEHSLFELLNEVRNAFVIVLSSLDMADLQNPTEMVKQKLHKLERLMEQSKKVKQDNGMVSDDYELHDEIADCVNTDEIEERLRGEIGNLGAKLLF